jgi:hypothetical protein
MQYHRHTRMPNDLIANLLLAKVSPSDLRYGAFAYAEKWIDRQVSEFARKLPFGFKEILCFVM